MSTARYCRLCGARIDISESKCLQCGENNDNPDIEPDQPSSPHDFLEEEDLSGYREAPSSVHSLKGAPKSQWRWLLVIPAFVVGLLVPGFLVRVSWELGTSWVPGMDILMMRWSEILQSGVDGFCAVYFARVAAPQGNVAVSIAAGLVIGGGVLWFSLFFTNYYEGVSTATILWNSALVIITIVAAGIAVWHTIHSE